MKLRWGCPGYALGCTGLPWGCPDAALGPSWAALGLPLQMFWEVHELLRALHIMRILCALHALCIPHVLRSALRSALHGLACARVSELG